jgi:hypothetical protein
LNGIVTPTFIGIAYACRTHRPLPH